MDTTEERKKQVQYYQTAEEDFWLELMHKIHPVWVDQGLIDETRKFSPDAKVSVTFPEQLPELQRGELAKALAFEVDEGFLSKRSAMLKLNPAWGEEDLENELQLIADEQGSFFGDNDENDDTDSTDTEDVQEPGREDEDS